MYKQLMAVQKLLGPSIHLIVTPSWLTDGGEWIDTAGDAAETLLSKKLHMTEDQLRPSENGCKLVVSLVYTTALKIKMFRMSKELTLQHDIQAADKQIVQQAFETVFGRQFHWTGARNKSMIIRAA